MTTTKQHTATDYVTTREKDIILLDSTYLATAKDLPMASLIAKALNSQNALLEACKLAYDVLKTKDGIVEGLAPLETLKKAIHNAQ